MEESKTKQKIVVEKNLLKTTGDGRWSNNSYKHSEESYLLRPFQEEDEINGGYYTVIRSEGKYLLGQRSIFRRRHNGPIALPYRQKGFNDSTFIGGGYGTIESGNEAYVYSLKELKNEALGSLYENFTKILNGKSKLFTLETNAKKTLYHVIELTKDQLTTALPFFKEGLATCADDEFSSFNMYNLEDALNLFIPNKSIKTDFKEFLPLCEKISKAHNEIVQSNIDIIKKFKSIPEEEKSLNTCLEIVLNQKDWKKSHDANILIGKILNKGIKGAGFSNINALKETNPKKVSSEWLADKKPRDWHYYFLELLNYAEEKGIWE